MADEEIAVRRRRTGDDQLNKKRFRKPSGIKSVLLIIVGVWAVIIVVVCVILWHALSNYQKKYDSAKASAQVDVCMSKIMADFDESIVAEAFEKYPQSEKACENDTAKAQHIAYFEELLEDRSVSWKDNENTTDSRPVYDIYVGETKIAVLTLGKSKTSDSYGFRQWEISSLVFDTDAVLYSDYTIKIQSGMSVKVDGVFLSSEDVVSTTAADPAIVELLTGKGIAADVCKIYRIEDYIGTPEVVVMGTDGLPLESIEPVDGVYDYSNYGNEELVQTVTQRVYDTCAAYTNNIYLMASFEDVAAYLITNSDAYSVILDVQASIVWSWQPTVVNIVSQKVSDIEFYGDSYFSCTYESSVYRANDTQSETEDFCYRMLFERVDNNYYLTYFVMG